MAYEIKFGTDGWRDVIGDGFTFKNVKRVSQAACDIVRKHSKSRLILIGFDRRFFSQRFAETAAQVASSNGYRVELSAQPIGSPTLSFNVKNRKAAAGFMITASHNPYQFNGFKIKGAHGGSVAENLTREIEQRIDTSDIQSSEKSWKKVEFSAPYIAALKKNLKHVRFSNLKGPVIFDGMHGPGAELFEKLMGKNERIIFIRKEMDPLFGGVNPEPIETNSELLRKTVFEKKGAIGIAVDGDADRIGVIDDKGRYLPPHTVMPLLLLHLIENRKLKGKVVQTISMGYLPGRIAQHFQLPFEEVSVGFKYIADIMSREKVLLGGEESGGYGVGLWFLERDGLLCAHLLLEMMATLKKPLSVIVDDLYKRFGVSYFKRVDFPMKEKVDKSAWTTFISSIVGPVIGGINIKKTLTGDGVKIVTEDDSWLLLRPSGTEPLMRTYAEGSSQELVEKLIKEAQVLANTPLPSPKKTGSDAGKSTRKKR